MTSIQPRNTPLAVETEANTPVGSSKGLSAVDQHVLNGLAQIIGVMNSASLAPSKGPSALEIPREQPDLKAANSYGVVDLQDQFKGQFAGLVMETWNNRPGETPKHVIVDCAGVTDFGARGDAANALRAELAPPNTLVIKVTQPLQGANIVLEREAGLPPADRRVSPELVGAALVHGVEKLLRASNTKHSLVDSKLSPVHLSGLSYATLPILSIAADHNIGNIAIFEPHVPAVALGSAMYADAFQALDTLPEQMTLARGWANQMDMPQALRGGMWAFHHSWANAPGRTMANLYGPMVRGIVLASSPFYETMFAGVPLVAQTLKATREERANLAGSFAGLHFADPLMPLMSAKMGSTFSAPDWVKESGLEPHYNAGIAARVAGAFPEEFQLKNVLARLPAEVAGRTQLVVQAGSAAATTVEEQAFATEIPGLTIKTAISPKHDMYTFDPAIAASEALFGIFPKQQGQVMKRYMAVLQKTQGFQTAVHALSLVEAHSGEPLSEELKTQTTMFVGKILAERQFAAEKNLGLGDKLETKQQFIAESLFPFLLILQGQDGEVLLDQESAAKIALQAAQAQVR